MGTRATTKFITEDGTVLVNMYRQCDGNPIWHGRELAEFLTGLRRIGCAGPTGTANGIHCLAAQVIAHFKTNPRDFYIVHPDQTEEWNYEVMENPHGDWTLRVNNDEGEVGFNGTPQDFLADLKENQEAA
jgi:hypothetical protein